MKTLLKATAQHSRYTPLLQTITAAASNNDLWYDVIHRKKSHHLHWAAAAATLRARKATRIEYDLTKNKVYFPGQGIYSHYQFPNKPFREIIFALEGKSLK